MTKPHPQLYPYEQNQEPITPPPGFGRPSHNLGDKVSIALTVFCPAYLKPTEGYTGTVNLIVFCKSDGKTILHGVTFDTPVNTGTGDPIKFGRYEGFELDPIKG